ncbi:hypothetical protein HY045_03845 [Candidatus Woesebacteria bacterium]|nr:hypothetical protein [Candidatus Woesebacteria bacterium]
MSLLKATVLDFLQLALLIFGIMMIFYVPYSIVVFIEQFISKSNSSSYLLRSFAGDGAHLIVFVTPIVYLISFAFITHRRIKKKSGIDDLIKSTLVALFVPIVLFIIVAGITYI